jgi:hypothetical protein
MEWGKNEWPEHRIESLFELHSRHIEEVINAHVQEWLPRVAPEWREAGVVD